MSLSSRLSQTKIENDSMAYLQDLKINAESGIGNKDFKTAIFKQIKKLVEIENNIDPIRKYAAFSTNITKLFQLGNELAEGLITLDKFVRENSGNLITIKYAEYSQLIKNIETIHNEMLRIKSDLDTDYKDLSNPAIIKQLLSLFKKINEIENDLIKITSKLKKNTVITEISPNYDVYLLEDKITKNKMYSDGKLLYTDIVFGNKILLDEESSKSITTCLLLAYQAAKKDLIGFYAKSHTELSDNSKKLFDQYLNKIPEEISKTEKITQQALTKFSEIKLAREQVIAKLNSLSLADKFKLFGNQNANNNIVGNTNTTPVMSIKVAGM